MEAKVTELVQKVNELETRLATAEKTNGELRTIVDENERRSVSAFTSASSATRATSNLAGQATVRAKAFIPRLSQFNAEKDDVRLFIRRFEAYVTANNLDDGTALSELVSHGTGPIANIVLLKGVSEWTVQTLKAAILQRLSPNWDLNRIEQELYNIEVKMNDDPESIMSKIERILVRKEDSISTDRLKITQYSHFIRLIHVQEPIHTYVMNKSEQANDPEEALKLAKEYLRNEGNTVNYFKRLVKTSMEEAGVPVAKSLESDNIFPIKPGEEATAAIKSTDNTNKANTQPQVATKTESTALQTQVMPKELIEQMQAFMKRFDEKEKAQAAANTQTDVSEVIQQFIKRGTNLEMEEIVRRLNDVERLKNDLKVAGMPDYLKKRITQENSTNWKTGGQGGNQKPNSDNKRNDNRPGNRFERNKKGKEKTYKKRFVEKDNGQFVAQFDTDESDTEEKTE